MFLVYHAFLSVHCNLVVTDWDRAVTVPRGVLGQAWYFIVSILEFYLFTYFSVILVLNCSASLLKSCECMLNPFLDQIPMNEQ